MNKEDIQKECKELSFIISIKNDLMRPVLWSVTDKDDVWEQDLYDNVERLKQEAIKKYNGGEYIGSHYPLSSGNIFTVLYKVVLSKEAPSAD